MENDDRLLSKLEAIIQTRRAVLQEHYNDPKMFKECLMSYVRAEVYLYRTLLRSDTVVEACQALDRAFIVAGPQFGILEAINELHRNPKFSAMIRQYNSNKWNPGEFNVQMKKDNNLETNFQLIHTLTEIPSLDSFCRRDREPILLKGFVCSWRALQQWNFWYLCGNFGHRIVQVEVGSSYLNEKWDQELLPLGDFLERLVKRDDHLYLAQYDLFSQIPELSSDMNIPSLIATLSFDNMIRNIWIGGCHSVTPFHTDPYDNFLCQVIGYKKVYLLNPIFSRYLNTDGNTSSFDPREFSGDIPVLEGLLGPGDALFIPSGWWHMVVGLTHNISVSLWFNPLAD